MELNKPSLLIKFLRYYYYRTRGFYELIFPNSGLNIKNSEGIISTSFLLILINISLIIVFLTQKFQIQITIIQNKENNMLLLLCAFLLMIGIYIFVFGHYISKNVTNPYHKYQKLYINEPKPSRRKNGWLLVIFQFSHIIITIIQMIFTVNYKY